LAFQSFFSRVISYLVNILTVLRSSHGAYWRAKGVWMNTTDGTYFYAGNREGHITADFKTMPILLSKENVSIFCNFY
jgi:hypothetical protein